MSKKLLIFSLVLFYSAQVYSWGKTGHRIVGEIAERNLSKEAKKGITEI